MATSSYGDAAIVATEQRRLTPSGRPWAVRGRPRTTGNHRRRPLRRRSRGGAVVVGQVGRAWLQFLRNKKQEWEEYRSEVTAFELRKNLPNL